MKAVMNKKLKAFFGAIKLESMHDIFIERINEKWKNEWINEWMNEWMNKWMRTG